LTLNARVAPIKVGVFPLLADDNMIQIAHDIDQTLRDAGISTYYDDGGTIGRRYARMDEVGTPFCVTVDHETLSDHAVTLRNRDTTKQERVQKDHLVNFLHQKLSNEKK